MKEKKRRIELASKLPPLQKTLNKNIPMNSDIAHMSMAKHTAQRAKVWSRKASAPMLYETVNLKLDPPEALTSTPQNLTNKHSTNFF